MFSAKLTKTSVCIILILLCASFACADTVYVVSSNYLHEVDTTTGVLETKLFFGGTGNIHPYPSPDGSILVICYMDKLYVYDSKTYECLKEFSFDEDTIPGKVFFSDDGSAFFLMPATRIYTEGNWVTSRTTLYKYDTSDFSLKKYPNLDIGEQFGSALPVGDNKLLFYGSPYQLFDLETHNISYHEFYDSNGNVILLSPQAHNCCHVKNGIFFGTGRVGNAAYSIRYVLFKGRLSGGEVYKCVDLSQFERLQLPTLTLNFENNLGCVYPGTSYTGYFYLCNLNDLSIKGPYRSKRNLDDAAVTNDNHIYWGTSGCGDWMFSTSDLTRMNIENSPIFTATVFSASAWNVSTPTPPFLPSLMLLQ